MDFRKIGLYLIAAILGVSLWTAWQHDYPPPAVKQMVTQTTTNTDSHSSNLNQSAPAPFVNGQQTKSQQVTSSTSSPSTAPVTGVTVSHSQHWINVKTDVLGVMIDPQGGSVVSAVLPKYPVSVKQKNTPIQIFSPNQNSIYVAQSDITSRSHTKPIRYRSAILEKYAKGVKYLFFNYQISY